MIGQALVFLRDQLNEFLDSTSGDAPQEPRVVFIDADRTDIVSLPAGRVSIFVVNVGTDNTLRSSDPFARRNENGKHEKILPTVRINLHVLFAARFTHYDEGLNHLASIIQFFQGHRVFDRENSPTLAPSR